MRWLSIEKLKKFLRKGGKNKLVVTPVVIVIHDQKNKGRDTT